MIQSNSIYNEHLYDKVVTFGEYETAVNCSFNGCKIRFTADHVHLTGCSFNYCDIDTSLIPSNNDILYSECIIQNSFFTGNN
jgi:hypothetical protein